MLVDGKWSENWQPIQNKDQQGRFIRQTSTFRHWITPDGQPGPTGKGGFNAEPNRYHLFVTYICPWAHRTLIARQLNGLEDLISVTVLKPVLTPQGWQFDHAQATNMPLEVSANMTYLHQLYTYADANYTGRATVPVLWDKKSETIVNNESSDILRMFNGAFMNYAEPAIDLYPIEFANDIDELNRYLYDNINNAVYQAGFASSQLAYEQAYKQVFDALDNLEQRLQDGRPYLFAEQLTESDIRLFVTLIRFDAAYHGLFKCNRNRILDMPNLRRYVDNLMQIPTISKTVHLDHIKAGYYSIKTLNPSGIVPLGPNLAYTS